MCLRRTKRQLRFYDPFANIDLREHAVTLYVHSNVITIIAVVVVVVTCYILFMSADKELGNARALATSTSAAKHFYGRRTTLTPVVGASVRFDHGYVRRITVVSTHETRERVVRSLVSLRAFRHYVSLLRGRILKIDPPCHRATVL